MTAVEVHPVIMHSSGYMDAQHAALPPDGHQNVGSPSRSEAVLGALTNSLQVCLAPSPYIDSGRHQNMTSFGDRAGTGGEMNRLEALVAVATSGENGPR